MSILKRGTLCVIIAGCPANIGVVVEVLARLGRVGDRSDAYRVRTASGRPFAQLWAEGPSRRYLRTKGNPNECVTDRHKLRPLIGVKDESGADDVAVTRGRTKDVELLRAR